MSVAAQELINLLSVAGCTAIIVYGRIFSWLRRLLRRFGISGPFTCPQCLGFWVGFIFQWLRIRGLDLPVETQTMNCFWYGCAGSITSYMLCMLVDDDGLRISGLRRSAKHDLGGH